MATPQEPLSHKNMFLSRKSVFLFFFFTQERVSHLFLECVFLFLTIMYSVVCGNDVYMYTIYGMKNVFVVKNMFVCCEDVYMYTECFMKNVFSYFPL